MNRPQIKQRGWSIQLLSIAGIPIRLHLSFFLLIAWVILDALGSNEDPIFDTLFVLGIFACILLHELSHALTAKFYKISTRDIVLYPFGGIATIGASPAPAAELVIAAAGPALNFVIAAILFPFSLGLPFSVGPEWASAIADRLVANLFFANLVLGIFNLIPALPMDGGRILRAALQLLGVKRATAISSKISQVLSIIMGLGGIYMGNPILVIVAVMVFSGAAQERFHEQARTTLADRKVREVMTDASLIQTFTHGTTVSQALSIACKSLQSAFPIVHGGRVIGLLVKDVLLQYAVSDGDDAYISGLMLREFPFCGPDEMVSDILDRDNFSSAIPLLVLNDGQLLGMVIRDQLVEYLIVQGMRQQAPPRGRPVDQEF